MSLVRTTPRTGPMKRQLITKLHATLEKLVHKETATGISDSPMLPGIAYRDQHCITHSVLMRARNRTVRRIQAYHDLARKTIRMHSTGQEMPL